MQSILHFAPVRLELPLACQYQVQSMVHGLLGGGLHPGPDSGNRVSVSFCLGQLEGPHRVDRERKLLLFSGGLQLELRTAQPEVDALLGQVLRPGIELTLCGQALTLDRVERTDFSIASSCCQAEMLTPLLVYRREPDRKTAYRTPLDGDFESLLVENYRRKYQAQTGLVPGPLSVVPLSVGARDKVVTRYKDTWFTGWRGRYRLQGSPQTLTFLYNAGLGQRNAAGFGMFRVLPKTLLQSPI